MRFWAANPRRTRRPIWRRAVSPAEPALYNPAMNILIACDSFKDALPADAVCRAIAAGLKRRHPDAVITEMPLSDGGEGLLEVLRAPLGLEWIAKEVADPLGRNIQGRYGLSADRQTCVVEMAEAS